MIPDFLIETSSDSCEIDLYLFLNNEWAAMDGTFAVLDLEVTAAFTNGGEVIGISALLVDSQRMKITELDLTVQPRSFSPNVGSLLPQISVQSDPTTAIDISVALQRLSTFVAGHDVFIHGADFALQFIEQAASEFDPVLLGNVFDTELIALMTWPGQCCSARGLREYLGLNSKPDGVTGDSKTTLEILTAARSEAWRYHIKRMTAAAYADQH